MDTQNGTEQELQNRLLDELLKSYKKPEDILGEQGLLKQLTKALLERALGAELTEHLGYEKHDPTGYRVEQTEHLSPVEHQCGLEDMGSWHEPLLLALHCAIPRSSGFGWVEHLPLGTSSLSSPCSGSCCS
jgi:hypothetical protein